MASNLRVDSIVPSTGSSVSIGTATGGVNIPGVLTYEDVTNVDSIGIITARSGVHVGPTAGVGATIYTDGGARFSGIVTATALHGDGSNLTGISAGVSLSNGADNRVITATSASAITGESNLTFDGTNLTAATGNVVIGTAAKGIDFSAQTASSDSGVTVGDEILNHYEEGTWTPVLRHYISGSFQPPAGNAGTVKGYYTRVGNVCYINATFSAFAYTNLNAISSFAQISELPFPASSSAGHISVIHTTGTAFTSGSGSDVVFITSGGNTYLNSKTNNSNWDWAILNTGSRYLYISGFYFVD